MRAAGFIADSATEIDAFINEGVQILHEKLVAAFGSNYVARSTTLSSTSDGVVALPSDFFSLLGVSMTFGGENIPLRPFAQAERDMYQGPLQWVGGLDSTPKYQLFGTANIRLRPIPPTGTPLVLEYSPEATALVAGGDTVNFPNGWERYVVVYTAIQMRIVEETSVTELSNVLEQMDKQLRELADLRDAGAPAGIADVNPDWGV